MTTTNTVAAPGPKDHELPLIAKRFFNNTATARYRLHTRNDKVKGKVYTLYDPKAHVIVSQRHADNCYVRGSIFHLNREKQTEQICKAVLDGRWSDKVLRQVAVQFDRYVVPLEAIVKNDSRHEEFTVETMLQTVSYVQALCQWWLSHRASRRWMTRRFNAEVSTPKDPVTVIKTLLDGDILWRPTDGVVMNGYRFHHHQDRWQLENVTYNQGRFEAVPCTEPPEGVHEISIGMFVQWLKEHEHNFVRYQIPLEKFMDAVQALGLDSRYQLTA